MSQMNRFLVLFAVLFFGASPFSIAKRVAIIETSEGTIECDLFSEQAPKAVDNFVGLATGKKAWTHPETGERKKSKYFNGLIFHRVIPGFMIQGGDPLGTGLGGPGYRFDDEIVPEIQFDRSGRLAMANSGPNTNGSQFFITVVPTPFLDPPNGRYTIFGQCGSPEVAKAISLVPRNARDKPKSPVVIKKVTIKKKK